MKKFLWLFVLICFTAPDGSPVWIAKEQVVAVVRDTQTWGGFGGMPKGSRTSTKIFLSSGNEFHVTETPDDVAEKLK